MKRLISVLALRGSPHRLWPERLPGGKPRPGADGERHLAHRNRNRDSPPRAANRRPMAPAQCPRKPTTSCSSSPTRPPPGASPRSPPCSTCNSRAAHASSPRRSAQSAPGCPRQRLPLNKYSFSKTWKVVAILPDWLEPLGADRNLRGRGRTATTASSRWCGTGRTRRRWTRSPCLPRPGARAGARRPLLQRPRPRARQAPRRADKGRLGRRVRPVLISASSPSLSARRTAAPSTASRSTPAPTSPGPMQKAPTR